MDNFEIPKLMAWLGGIGAAVGLGQLLTSDQPLSWRWVIGRALASGGLGASAAAVVIVVPGLSFVAQCGLAAALASIGVSGVDRVFSGIFRAKGVPIDDQADPH